MKYRLSPKNLLYTIKVLYDRWNYFSCRSIIHYDHCNFSFNTWDF